MILFTSRVGKGTRVARDFVWKKPNILTLSIIVMKTKT